MPIYSYRCTKCGKKYDAMRSFSDSDKDDVCPDCGAVAKRQISTDPAAVIYKGSGFYCTDKGGSGCSGCPNSK